MNNIGKPVQRLVLYWVIGVLWGFMFIKPEKVWIFFIGMLVLIFLSVGPAIKIIEGLKAPKKPL